MPPPRETPNQPGPLAGRLRSIREEAGLTGAQLAQEAGWGRPKVVKIETGRQVPSEDDIRTWATICRVPEAAPRLIGMLGEEWAVHQQWQHKLRMGQAALQGEYETLVRGATRIRNFEIMLIPGLLQTPEYTRYRALEAVRLHGADENGVGATVTARMRRGEVLYVPGKTFEFVITQAALQYLLCPPGVMLGQLDRLAVAAGMPNVTLGIIRPGTELAVAPMAGFMIAGDLVMLETFTSMDVYQGGEAAKYGEIFDALMAESVTGDAARALIRDAADELRD